MAVYLSPGVYLREIDLSVIPSAQGALRPAFIGASKKGPMNTPTLITSGAQFIETFGEPFPDSYLGYAVISFLEEGASCWVLRVGVEYQEGMDTSLEPDAIDTSGARNQGWGRIPVYTGIDYGKIYLRPISADNPVVIHAASVGSTTSSNSDAVLSVTAATGGYTGCYDEVFSILITSDPTGTNGIEGAGYTLSSTTAGEIETGTLGSAGTITDLVADYALSLDINLSTGTLAKGDIFTFAAQPDNQEITVTVEGIDYTSTVPVAGTVSGYASATDLAAAINGSLATAAEFEAVVVNNDNDEEVVALQTTDAGKWIQLAGNCAFCAEVGVSQYAYDIPRSYLLCTDPGPTYNFSSANNRVVVDVVGQGATKRLDFTLNTGVGTTEANLVSLLDSQGTVGGTLYFNCISLTVPGGNIHPVMITSTDNMYDQLKLLVSWVFQSTMRFAAEVGIEYPYSKAYRSFWDSRRVLPTVGTDGSTPVTCELASPSYDAVQCSLDSSYYQNVVGWFVAKYPGTWSDKYYIGLEVFIDSLGDSAGRFSVTVYDADGVAVDLVQDVSFDPAEDRYIANVVNEGSVIGGANGNSIYQWEARPSFLIDATTVRVPSTFRRQFAGGANGIPSDPLLSEALDDAIIGNPSTATGLYALNNSESYDFNLLLIPGITSGSVIGRALQFCENRGDVLFLVDPPYGLRSQQVVEWHNGMLYSDLANAINSSYGALYWSWLKIADQFNGGSIWVPPSGHVAAVFARTDRTTEQWFAPAGINRGRLFTPIDTEFNPTRGEQDVLYGSGNAVNPIVKFAREGITIWGQRTLQRKSSALDRVNVRMLLIYIKKNLSVTLRAFNFEPNDGITRKQVESVVNPFLADLAARRGIEAFKVICDETNNTPERRDRKELWVTIFIKPVQAAEFIVVNLVTLRSDASFSSQEILAAGGVVTTQ